MPSSAPTSTVAPSLAAMDFRVPFAGALTSSVTLSVSSSTSGSSTPTLSPGCFSHLAIVASVRSEEHTSELQSLMRISYAVFCLKKKKKNKKHKTDLVRKYKTTTNERN